MVQAAAEKLILWALQHILTDSAKQEFLAFLLAKGVPAPICDIIGLVIGVMVAAPEAVAADAVAAPTQVPAP